jgi:hypothetical protein
VYEVMQRKRPLSLEMIRRLHERFGIPAEVLIRPVRTRPRRRAAQPATDRIAAPFAPHTSSPFQESAISSKCSSLL